MPYRRASAGGLTTAQPLVFGWDCANENVGQSEMQVNVAMNLGLVPKIITVSPELKLLDSNIGAQKQERGAVRILPVWPMCGHPILLIGRLPNHIFCSELYESGLNPS